MIIGSGPLGAKEVEIAGEMHADGGSTTYYDEPEKVVLPDMSTSTPEERVDDIVKDYNGVTSSGKVEDSGMNNDSFGLVSGDLNSFDYTKFGEMLFNMMDKYVQMEMAYNQQGQKDSMEFNERMADKEMAFNREEAQKNREWQEKMSNTSIQRAVADMKAAGINPLLMASKGVSASTPGGASASANSARSTGNASISGMQQYLPSLLNALVNQTNSNVSVIRTIISLATSGAL